MSSFIFSIKCIRSRDRWAGPMPSPSSRPSFPNGETACLASPQPVTLHTPYPPNQTAVTGRGKWMGLPSRPAGKACRVGALASP